TPITKVDTVGISDNLADYTNKKTKPDEVATDNIPSSIASGSAVVPPVTTRTTNLSQPTYSFTRSSRSTRTSSESRGPSRSISPVKPTTTSAATPITSRLGLRASNTTQKKVPSSTSVHTNIKPSSPLSTFSLTASTSKPATSNITVNALPPTATTSDRQLSRESTAETETIVSPRPVMQATGFDTIVEGDEPEMPIGARGDSTSLNSPMVRLMEEYTGETIDNSISTDAWVRLLATMADLESEHVERIEDPNKGVTRYRLSENLLATLNRITVELQVFVERAAGLIEERVRHYTVDPQNTLLHILRGTSSLPQLNVAWKTIQKRLELGHRTLQKYALQYQHTPEEDSLLLSPISTLPDIHDGLQDLRTADQRLRYLYQNFPHHHDQLTPQAESVLNQSKSWMNILPLPDTLKGILIPEAEYKEQKQSKGKQKETRVEIDEEDESPTERIWLGSDTPYKGPNKWFGGGRLKPR
ncbi:hypothetical protein K443DRAFT_69065, partial [Laccaria amethystina LaAM-08-1]